MLEVFDVKKSEFVLKIAFDGDDIFVKLVGNKYFCYHHLPRSVFEKFCAAPSKGTFLNKTLKKMRHGVPCFNPEF